MQQKLSVGREREKDVSSIDVKNAYESIGSKQFKTLLGYYYDFSGSDLMGSPSWKHGDNFTTPPMLYWMPSCN